MDLIAWFTSLPSAVQPAVITVVGNAVLFFLGFGTLAVSIWGARATTLAGKKTELKLQVYERILEQHRAATDAIYTAANYVQNLMGTLRVYADAGQLTSLGTPRQRWQEFNKLYVEATKQASEMHATIESWQAIDKRLDIFGLAFGVQRSQVLDAWSALSGPLMGVMPVEDPSGGPYPWKAPTPERIEELVPLVERYAYELHLLGAYIEDFRTEMQLLLLRGLFRGKPKRRDPPDPAQFAIRLDRARQIRKAFAQHEVFQHGRRLEAEARAKFGTKAGRPSV